MTEPEPSAEDLARAIRALPRHEVPARFVGGSRNVPAFGPRTEEGRTPVIRVADVDRVLSHLEET